MIKDIFSDVKLRLSINNPNYEDCYVDGYACALAELPEEMNPYRLDKVEAYYWIQGWWDAVYNKYPLFHLEGTSADNALSQSQDDYKLSDFIVSFLEISGVLAVSSLLGYQVWGLVA